MRGRARSSGRVGTAGSEKRASSPALTASPSLDSLAFVVERDNARVQVLRLPDFEPLGTLGEERLRRPYGLTVFREEERRLRPLRHRQLRGAGRAHPARCRAGRARPPLPGRRPGRRRGRRARARLRGHERGRRLAQGPDDLVETRPWTASSSPTSRRRRSRCTRWAGGSPATSWGGGCSGTSRRGSCSTRAATAPATGSAQTRTRSENTFHVFDRQTLRPVGSFAGASTGNTDGIALTQRGFEPFPEGALYAVHDDGSVHALSWADVAEALGLRRDCAE